MKTNANMVDANSLKHISPMNHHVSEVTPQVLVIPNDVLQVRDHHLFYLKNSQLLKVNIFKVQFLKSQVLNIEILEV
jgi:hypothetical protein